MKTSAITALLLGAMIFTAANGAAPYRENWSIQFGTSADDFGYSIANDSSGNYYVAGSTRGNFAGINAGADDSFLQQFSPAGALGWSTQAGTSHQERYRWVSSTLGNVYFLTGMETAAINGMPGLYRYNSSGTLLSTTITGFPDLGNEVETSSITTDCDGNVYVVGSLQNNFHPTNGFVAKINSLGETVWHRMTNTVPGNFERLRTAVDRQGNVYVAESKVTLNQTDLLIIKYNSEGDLLWSGEYGTPFTDTIEGLALDVHGNPVITGLTYGDFGSTASGGGDAYVLKIDISGNVLWTTQFGDAALQGGQSVAIVPSGHIFVAGHDWVVPEQINGDYVDAFWAELDSAGNLLWRSRFGTAGQNDIAHEIVVNIDGDILMTGQTGGSLYGPNQGGLDAFVVEFDVNAIPEPNTLVLGVLCCIAVGSSYWRPPLRS